MNEDEIHAHKELLKILKQACVDFENATERKGQFANHDFSLHFLTGLEFVVGQLSDTIGEFSDIEDQYFPDEANNGF